LPAVLPTLSGEAVARVIASFSWTMARQRGRHVVVITTGETATPSIPDHREVAKGTLRALSRAANLTTDEFVAAA
jgi:predicted RNA binding protein YcfA (HicA-like mRNA interferase family)